MSEAVNVHVSPEHAAAMRGSPLLIFAGGGSGGHIYPGLAIAGEFDRIRLESRHGDKTGSPRIVFVTSDRAIDAKVMNSSPYQVERSPARPAIARPAGMLRFLRGWFAAKRHARSVLREKGAPPERFVHVVAMGGFVAAPFVHEAKRLSVGVTMVNLDAVPGKANRYIARHADRVFTSARVTAGHGGKPAWIEIPPIIRGSLHTSMTRGEARQTLKLDPDRPVLMVTGGSQGLRSLNEFVQAFAESASGRTTLVDGRWQVIHQTGRNLDEAARAAYQRAGIDARVEPFTDMMGVWYRAADVVVCTAGAGNIAELWSCKRPSLLLPYPHHKDQHQVFNAAPLVDAEGAALGRDLVDARANMRQNGAVLQSLLIDAVRREAMRANLEKLGPADGARRIAEALWDTIRAGSGRS